MTAPAVETSSSPEDETPREAPPRDDVRLARLAGALLGAALVLLAIALGVTEAAGLQQWQWESVFVAALVGVALARWRRVLITMAWLTGAGAFLLVFVAGTAVTRSLVPPLVRIDPPPARGELEAIVVLSAWLDRDGHLNEQAVDRLLTGLELYRIGMAPRLVLSRVWRGSINSDLDQQRLLKLVDRPVALTVVDDVHGTRDEARRVAALGLKRVAVVTSPTHTRRACATFEAVGLRVTCVPSAGRGLAWRTLSTFEARVTGFQEWLYETLGTSVYRSRGWMR